MEGVGLLFHHSKVCPNAYPVYTFLSAYFCYYCKDIPKRIHSKCNNFCPNILKIRIYFRIVPFWYNHCIIINQVRCLSVSSLIWKVSIRLNDTCRVTYEIRVRQSTRGTASRAGQCFIVSILYRCR